MFNASLFTLAIFTLSSVLAIGVWEYVAVSKSLAVARVKRRD